MSIAGLPQAGPGDEPVNSPFPIVGIGASSGGLEAFTQLLSVLPENTDMAFVLVQHLDPKHESSLRELLAKATRMPVLEAADGDAVRPNHIYVIPPNTTMTIAQGVLQLTPRSVTRGPHLPIDHFFKSLAEDRQTGAVGVILSGSGTDGTLGLAEIKAAGGITLAQDEQSAKYAGMPQSAVRSGCVDLVLTPAEIARELARLGGHPYVNPAPTVDYAPPAAQDEENFKKILALLHSSFGVDFSAYRETTVKRRIRRRMALHTQGSLADYSRHVDQNRAELEVLFQDILINVTSFFREPETYETLKQKVFPEIFEGKDPNTPIRIWVPGCSTGQEAYSLAIALLEFQEERTVKPEIQIFATDLSDASLDKARGGIYPENIEGDVSPERLRRFFTKEDGNYRVSKAVRDLCVIAKQNVAGDPPFSRVDLISCRNLLIYLSPPLQKRVIPTFHYALNPVGFLLLGASETVGSFTDLFELVDQKHRMYVKKATAVPQHPQFSMESYQAAARRGFWAPMAASSADWHREADRVALGHYAPPGVLVNENFDILQYRGDTGPYLAPAPGEPSHNLLKMARTGLFTELRGALTECRQKGIVVRREGVRVRGEGVDREIEINILPLKLAHAGDRCFLVLFDETTRRASAPQLAAPERAKSTDDSEIALLRQELASTREYLQSVIEQQDASNEELKSANEEILSTNEELQSTNEELETAKEELQSTNEELTTLNEQLRARNRELSQLTDALTNLQTSANVPVVELGTDLRVRRFTPAAAKLLNLVSSDIGRSIGDLKLAVEVPDLEEWIKEVVDTVQVKEHEVRDSNGRWYALRLHPYRTTDNRIDGAVVVLVDIHEIRSAQEALRESERRFRLLVSEVKDYAIFMLDTEGRVVSWNLGAERIKGYRADEIVGRHFSCLYPPEYLAEGRPERALRLAAAEGRFEDEGWRTRKDGSKFWASVVITALHDESGRLIGFAKVTRDWTERKRLESRLAAEHAVTRILAGSRSLAEASEKILQTLGETLGSEFGALWIVDRDSNVLRCITTWHEPSRNFPEFEAACRQRAFSLGTGLLGRVWASNEPADVPDVVKDDGFLRKTIAAKEDLHSAYSFPIQAGHEVLAVMEFLSHEIRQPDEAVLKMVSVLGSEIGQFIERLRAEEAMRQAREQLAKANEDLERRVQERTAEIEEANRALLRDIEVRERLEEQLLQAQKMESIGTLAAGVAHDFNNILNIIEGYSSVLRRHAGQNNDIAEALIVIDEQVTRGAALARQLLTIGRKTEGKMELTSVNALISELVRMLQETFPKTIEVRPELDADLPPVMADPNQITQALLNLCVNSRDAMPDGGRLTLETGVIDGTGQRDFPEPKAEWYVCVKVTDTGAGIDESIQSRLFEPFFTTKGKGRGTGLGLAIVYSVVQSHNGIIQVESQPMHGATFRLYVPVASSGK